MNNWKDYYNLSMMRNEQGINRTTTKWFATEHGNWAAKNQGVLEVAHLQAEHQSQNHDPKQLLNLYTRKEQDDAKALQLTMKLEDGSFRQKEKFKFKDFQKDSQQAILKKRKEAQQRERMHMDSLIAAHLLKQRTTMDFKTYFQFKPTNKHLPGDLKQIEEVKQFMVLNGMDESLINNGSLLSGGAGGGIGSE